MQILVIEKDRDLLDSISKLLEKNDFVVSQAFDGIQAIEELATNRFDLVISNLDIPRIPSQEIFEKIKQNSTDIKILAIANEKSQNTDTNIDDFLYLPFCAEDLLQKIENIKINNM